MIELPELEYDYADLEPHIDAKTMEIHHKKHHQAYITNYVKAIDDTPLVGQRLNDVLWDGLSSVPDNIASAVQNNGGGHLNHSLFWRTLSPNTTTVPDGDFSTALNDTFGGFNSFKSSFESAAMARFGSGWVWLIVNESGNLVIATTPNQDTPLMLRSTPILGLDVWEHAYYLNYQNRRLDYVRSFWAIVNWERVSEYYGMAKTNDRSFLV